MNRKHLLLYVDEQLAIPYHKNINALLLDKGMKQVQNNRANINILTKTQNEPEQAKTSWNSHKPAKTTKKSCKTTPNNQKFQSWGNLKFSASFHFSNFGAKRINFLILTKFCMYPILNVLISNLLFGFEKLEPKGSNLDILDQKVLTF